MITTENKSSEKGVHEAQSRLIVISSCELKLSVLIFSCAQNSSIDLTFYMHQVHALLCFFKGVLKGVLKLIVLGEKKR